MKCLALGSLVVGLVFGGLGQVPTVQDLKWDCVRPVYIVAGDLNGDGWDDLAVACHSCNTIMVGLNPKSATCPAPCPVAWPAPKVFSLADSPTALAWGLFFSKDAYEIKIVTITQYQPAWASFKVTDPTTVKLSPLTTVTGTHLTLGDFDADGVLDVAVLDSLGLKIVFPASKIAPIDLSGLAQICHVAFLTTADFDRDGDLDLVVASNNSLLFFENTCLGKFAFKTSVVLGHMLRGIAILDADDDGKPDLAVVDPAFAALTLVRNAGCWKFEVAQRVKLDGEPVSVVAADFDRDGKTDIAVAEYGADCVTVLRNIGGRLALDRSLKMGKNPISLAVGDFDRNGILDLAVALFGGGPSGTGPAVQIVYNPMCTADDCTGKPPCCQPGPAPGPRH